MRPNKFSRVELKGAHVSSIVNDVIKTISDLLICFLQKNVEHEKTQIKPKPTNKTKISKQKMTKATSLHAQNLLRGGNCLFSIP